MKGRYYMPKLENLAGQTFGVWKVIERDLNPKSKSHETFWICECQNCGNIASVRKTNLKQNPRSCNNCKGQVIRQTFEEKGITKSPIHIGDKFGLLTIIGSADKEYRGKKGYWKCLCDCGNIVNVRTEHLLGQGKLSRTISCGCSKISGGELKIKQILEEENINFRYQYIINDFNRYAPFDFAIMDNNNNLIKLIEFDGEQHYRPIEYFGGQEQFKRQVDNDKKKDEYCFNHGIKLQRIPYYEYDNINLNMLLS